MTLLTHITNILVLPERDRTVTVWCQAEECEIWDFAKVEFRSPSAMRQGGTYLDLN